MEPMCTALVNISKCYSSATLMYIPNSYFQTAVIRTPPQYSKIRSGLGTYYKSSSFLVRWYDSILRLMTVIEKKLKKND